MSYGIRELVWIEQCMAGVWVRDALLVLRTRGLGWVQKPSGMYARNGSTYIQHNHVHLGSSSKSNSLLRISR